MSGFSRFGDYVLLRKLSEDALGESYRAGRVDDAGVLSDVALLRLFSGAGIDAQRLVDNQRPVPQADGGSGLPRQLAMGVEAGICFVAYEYSAGKDLATLIKRANDGFSSMAAEHALLIAERVAKGLAWLHREHQTAHGFLVPELVQVSDEGETKLHGFEVGPALVPLAIHGAIKPAFRSYLSPEVLAGATPGPRDDVFSLGALLLQLLTGTPPGAEESVSARLQRARLVENEQPIPATLQQLIAESLAPPSSRPADAKVWHEQFGTWMAESGIRATNFDLAFFVQELFRDELKRETVERDDERRQLLAPAPSVAASTPASAAATQPLMMEPPASVLAESKDERPIPAIEPAAGGRGKLLGGVAALAVLGLAGWFLVPRFLSSDSDQSPAVVQAESQQVVPPESDPVGPPGAALDPAVDPAELGGVADEEGAGSARATSLDAASDDLEKLIQERASALEERLATEYDREIATMRSQLEAARKIEAEARAALTAGASAESDPSTAANTVPAGIVAETAPAETLPTETLPAETLPTEGLPTETSTTETSVAEVSAGANGAAEVDTNAEPPSVAATTVPSSAAGATALVPPTSTTAAEPAALSPATTDRAGQDATNTSTATPLAGLAGAAGTTGASSTPPPPKVTKAVAPHLIEPPTPRYPASARNARRSATVIVKVLVGRDGRVLQADTVSDKKVGFGFDQAALSAARKAIYEPATVDGKAIEQWTTLVLRFEP